MHMHASLRSCGQQSSDATESGNGCEGLVVVDPLGLGIPLGHEPTLVPGCLALLESQIEKMAIQLPIPTTRGLLQPVQGQVKVAHLLFFTFQYETLRLAHVDVLF